MRRNGVKVLAGVIAGCLIMQSPLTVMAAQTGLEDGQVPAAEAGVASGESESLSQEDNQPQDEKAGNTGETGTNVSDTSDVTGEMDVSDGQDTPGAPGEADGAGDSDVSDGADSPEDSDVADGEDSPDDQVEPPVVEIPVVEEGWTCQEIYGDGDNQEIVQKIYRRFEEGQLKEKWVYFTEDSRRELYLQEEDTVPQVLVPGRYAIGADSVTKEEYYYYLDEKGIHQEGWQSWEEKWFYFLTYDETDAEASEQLRKETAGIMQEPANYQGLTKINGITYYLNGDGTYVKDNYVVIGNHKYIFDAEGKCIKDYEIQKAGWKKTGTVWMWVDEDGTSPVNTWRNISGKYYYFDGKGYMKSGWLKLSGKWYYLGSANDGSRKSGWLKLNNKWYYLNQDGVMQTGAAQVGGKWYCFGGADDGAMKANGWHSTGGKWYYLGSDGAAKKGWLKLKNKWYYLGSDAAMQTGWGWINSKWYYFGGTGDGAMKSGWQKVGGKWYHLGSAGDGSMKKGWLKLNNKWYYLNPGGDMQSGWLTLGSKRYYLGGANDGVMKSGWQKLSGRWYYFGSAGDGSMKTGWLKLGNVWYYLDGADENYPGVMLANCKRNIGGADYWFNGSGAMRTGWVNDGGWYYIKSSGAKSSGWVKDKNKWYYLDGANQCKMLAGCWKEINGKKYYFSSSGAMATGKVTINGAAYYFGGANDGAMKTGWQDINGGRFYFYSDGTMAVNTTIDGQYIGTDGSSGAKYTLNQIWQTNDVAVWNTNYKLSGSSKTGLDNAIKAFSNSGYTVSFVMVDVKTGQALSYKACQPLYSASAIKGPYVISLLNAGNAPNSTMWNTINWSSNSDYFALRGRYGSGVFQSWLKQAGVSESQGSSSYTTTTSLDLAKMWLKGYEFFNNGSSNASWAKSTYQKVLNSFISGKLASGKTVYSKAGWIAEGGYYNVYNDAGIVMAGNSPYILAVMSNCPGTAKQSIVQNLIGQLDKIHSEMVR